MKPLNWLGDIYHKHLYRHIAKASSGVTDLTSHAISDSLLGLVMYLPEIFGVGITYSIYNHISTNQPMDPTRFLTETGVLAGVFAGTYGLNFLRTPLEEKIGLELPSDLDKDRETRYSIKRANELHQSPVLSLDELNDRVNDALDKIVIEFEGYSVAHAKKTKISWFSNALTSRNIDGLMNPLIQEVVITNDRKLETIAHEKAHLTGYAREAEAVFVGYASMQCSSDPSLNYLAYLQRLRMCRDEFKLNIKYLMESGLNQRSIDEIRAADSKRREGEKSLSSYSKRTTKLAGSVRSMMLALIGQGNILKAYVSKPLRMIAAFDPAD
ncbi:MAG: DUF3810 family protein [Nanoarchaeota archaeon]